MNFKSAILVGGLGLLAANALAEDNKNFYIQGNLGYAFGVAPGGRFEQNTLSDGDAGVYALAVGYKFNDHIRAGFEVEYRDGYENKFSVEQKSAYIAETDDEYVIGYNTWTDTQITKIRSLSSMFSVYYDITKIHNITPYVLLGAGVARNVTDSSGTIYNHGGPQTHYSFSRGTNINFAWKIGAGVQYQIHNNINLDLHYQYVDLGKFKTGNIFTSTDHTKQVHPNLEGKLQSHEVLLGMAYKF